MVGTITLDALEIRRRGRTILGPLNCTLKGQGITVVMGPNGAGKTTFLRTLHGMERVSGGRVSWYGGAPDPSLQAFLFQTPILMRRSVLDNIAFPLILDGMKKPDARTRAEELAQRMGLRASLTGPAYQLSGGERQKMAMARALTRAPKILFLDEFSANLDGRSTLDLERIVLELAAGGTRIIMASHDLGQARRLADDVLFLHQGKLVEQNCGSVFFQEPETKEAKAYIKGDIVL